jgi:uncharacterized membrane protein
MPQEVLIYNSIKAIHILGFLLWVGSMFALSVALRYHERAGADRDAIMGLERAIGRAMELGALLAIAAGVYMILTKVGPVSPMKQPYLHIKLTLVVVLIAMHGVVRAKMARLGRGQGSAPGAWLGSAILVLAVAAIWLAVVKPMLRVS